MEAQKVINTFMKYLEEQMVPSMTNVQEFAFYTVWESVKEEADALVAKLTANPLTRAIVAIDKDGNVDAEKLISRLRKTFASRGKLSVEVPMFGTVCFNEKDLDAIEQLLMEGHYENNS